MRGPGLPCSNLRRLVGEEDYDDDWIHFFARRLQFLYFSRESFLPLSLKNDAEQSQNNRDNFPSNTNAFAKVSLVGNATDSSLNFNCFWVPNALPLAVLQVNYGAVSPR